MLLYIKIKEHFDLQNKINIFYFLFLFGIMAYAYVSYFDGKNQEDFYQYSKAIYHNLPIEKNNYHNLLAKECEKLKKNIDGWGVERSENLFLDCFNQKVNEKFEF